jgi:hypothetical protein
MKTYELLECVLELPAEWHPSKPTVSGKGSQSNNQVSILII